MVDEVAGHDDEGQRDQSEYYPTNQMPIAGELEDRRREFNELREEFVLGYTYNTARAYWSDLEQIADWAEERGKDVLGLTEKDLKQYVALLRRRKYSESTIRRRGIVWTLFLSTWGRRSEDTGE